MSHKKHQVWVLMPFLGMLLMSPHDIQSKYGRSIASEAPAPASQPASETPKFDAFIKDLTVPEKPQPLNLSAGMLKEDISSLLEKANAAELADKDSTKEQVDKHRNELTDSVIALLQVEKSVKDIFNHEGEEDLPKLISDAKKSLDGSIGALEESEKKLASSSQPQPKPQTPAPQVASSTPAAPTPAAPQRAPSVVPEETHPDSSHPAPAPSSTPTSTEDKDPVLCALENQNKLLQATLQTLMTQQQMIMQQMMGMQQQMILSSMYKTQDTFNYNQMYQYQQPQVAGNWVYYPNGMQPIQPGQTVPGQQSQSNIFGLNQPQMQSQYNPYGMGMNNQYSMMGSSNPMMFPFSQPDMMGSAGQGQWGLQSQFSHAPGNFSMDTMGFNMSSPVPMASQPTMPQAPAMVPQAFGGRTSLI